MKPLRSLRPGRSLGLQAFLLGVFVAFAAFLPYIIYDKGLFLYYGDFNVQQIPFYQLANEAVRTGNIWWNWNTDLGANFIGSYSFYLLFSPFFWLSLLVPPAFTPYLMAPLLMLKSGCASLTAYLYLKRFVRDPEYAVIGGLLYAFSGFSVYNIFFNHFHEVIVFFPLLLIGLEEAMTEGKKGRFALAITVNAMVNYWFFIGEVFFVAFYFLVRFTDPKWRLSVRKFLSLAVEAVLGMGLAMVAFLPSVLAVMGNPRTTADNLLLGPSLWYYSNPQRYLGILQSIFFAPDMPALNNWFPDRGATWSSLSAYIPMFSAAGVIAWLRRKSPKKDWLKRMLILSFIMAMVPMLNHLFVLENYSYYTRWFYMPVLLMCLATVKAIEESGPDGSVDLAAAMRITALVMALFLVMVGLTPKKSGDEWVFGMYQHLGRFLATAGITLAGFLAVALLLRTSRNHPHFKERLLSMTMVGCFLFTTCAMLIGKATYPNNQWIYEVGLPGRDQMNMNEEGEFARSDIYNGNDNLGMYWNIPNIQAFHSVVPISIMEFYPEVDVKRDVSSKPDVKYPELRSLLSVRWLYIKETEPEQDVMPGYTLVDQRLGYNIYQNDNFIPMGFAYDYYMDEDDWEEIPKEYRSRCLLRAIYLDGGAIRRNSDLMTQVDEDTFLRDVLNEDFSYDAARRSSMACDDFTIDRDGFTAHSSFDQDRLVFFSVPYDEGWSATVNGETAIIEQVNVGFMAVRVPAGDAEIRFVYRTPGLALGAVISVISLLALLCYLFFLAPRFLAEAPALIPDQLEQVAFGGPLEQESGEADYQPGQDHGASMPSLEEPLEEAAQPDSGEEISGQGTFPIRNRTDREF